jgi:hypothetical protein
MQMTSAKKVRKPKARMGRPPLPAKARKRVNLTFRVREETREWLGIVAEKSGRSISAEIEHVLETHRSTQDVLIRALGSKHAADILSPLMLFLSQLDRQRCAWNEDAALASRVKTAAQAIVDAAISKRVIPHAEYESLFDRSLAFEDPQNRIVSLAVAVMEVFGLAEPLPNRLLAMPLRR